MRGVLATLLGIGLIAGTTAHVLHKNEAISASGVVPPAPSVRAPQFQDFPVSIFSEFNGSAGVGYVIAESDENIYPVTYAGRHYVETKRCGDTCQLSTVYDAYSGEELATDIVSQYGVVYVPDSLLLVVNPQGVRGTEFSTDYYLLDKGKFTWLFSVDASGEVKRDCTELPVEGIHPVTDEVETFPSTCALPSGWEMVRG